MHWSWSELEAAPDYVVERIMESIAAPQEDGPEEDE
jgi:hypothetical protein